MIHIAVCDDEEYFRLREKKLVGEYMEKRKYSYTIDTYSSGKEMLDAANMPLQYDIIFLDINMEELDGLETARRIREISAKVSIVFVKCGSLSFKRGSLPGKRDERVFGYHYRPDGSTKKEVRSSLSEWQEEDSGRSYSLCGKQAAQGTVFYFGRRSKRILQI